MSRATALTLILTAALLVPATAGAGSQDRVRDVLLDLPYVTQTDQLCGGAALAMVLRYWGVRDVFAEDFAPLVDDRERGIRTSVLARAASERGLDVVAPPASGNSLDWVRAELRLGRPIIALIQERPSLYHYVVIVGVTDTTVIFHDPARAPFRIATRADFEARWNAADRWLLVSLPHEATAASRTAAIESQRSGDHAASPCQALVASSVTQAQSGDVASAERGLTAATSLCPDDAEGWVELAGLRFLARDYGEAASFASRALQVDPRGPYAWRILGTTEFLDGDALAALGAWNHLGEPTADRILVEGADRTPHPIVVRTVGIMPRTLLTPAVFERAARRLRELPVTGSAALRYEPQSGGTATITAVIDEQAPYPAGAVGWTAVGVNAAFAREVRLGFFGLARQGDAARVAYRFRENRPRLAGEFAVPTPGPLPGVMTIEAMWERQAYSPVALGGDTVVREVRRRTAVRWSDWATGWLRWEVRAGADRFDDRRSVVVEADVGTRWARDHVALRAGWSRWLSRGTPGFAAADLSAAWRSDRAGGGWGWLARGGFSAAGANAPLALWPLASSSSSRGVLLRGHDLFDEGIVTTTAIGRRLASGTVEYGHPIYRHALGALGIAGFIDAARVWRGVPGRDSASGWQFDVGAGLRIRTPAVSGHLRLDLGHAIRTGHTSLSAGYTIPWGS